VSACSDTRGRERTATVGGVSGEAVGGGAVGVRHARQRGREAAVGTPACGPDSVFKARVQRGKWWLTGGPLMSAISELKFTPRRK
jgi:hypothetical protein